MAIQTAKRPGDVPTGNHYAIIIFKSQTIHHEGDERSRTHPGHGYPAYTETLTTNEYKWTLNKEEWVKEIEYLERARGTSHKEEYAAIEVIGKAQVETKVVVK